ncbi:TetR/AcrR family transcriptional regulator [Patulibacter defluvii]|uniref:TetR/AcrR family transcriptional regulator n=1 Tax=Patulibacter defluvii TaxID=3095358 RepID=UPI002A750C0C|nr:TetR/AcrR family transcriptional regulator [Patulibacter sp. DM4]
MSDRPPETALAARKEPPTRKGLRQADAILDAALRSVAHHGYAATSVGRVAKEAGVTKRMVLYYFATRTHLIDLMVRRIGERLVAQVREAIAQQDDPVAALQAGVAGIWDGFTSDRVLIAAYFGVVSEAALDERLRPAATAVIDDFKALVPAWLDRVPGIGERLLIDEETFSVLVVAGVRGLLLEFLERGDTPALQRAIGAFQRGLEAMLGPAPTAA